MVRKLIIITLSPLIQGCYSYYSVKCDNYTDYVPNSKNFTQDKFDFSQIFRENKYLIFKRKKIIWRNPSNTIEDRERVEAKNSYIIIYNNGDVLDIFDGDFLKKSNKNIEECDYIRKKLLFINNMYTLEYFLKTPGSFYFSMTKYLEKISFDENFTKLIFDDTSNTKIYKIDNSIPKDKIEKLKPDW